MAQENFWIDLVATLKKAQSKKQVQSDAKNLGEIKVPLIGTLSKAKTKAQLKQDLASLNGTINLTGKVNQKGIVTSVQQATSQAQAAADKKSIQVSMNLKKDKLINDIKILGQQNTKMFKDANMSAKYNSLLDNAKLATSSKEIANLRLQLSAMRSEIKATNLSGLTLGDTFKKTFKRATELFTGTGGVMLLSQQMRKAWTEAINLDKAYTDLIKVQDELSRGDYPTYLEQCNKKAQELASTQKALIEGATEFSKSGYTKTISDGLSEKSTILANVGDMSASDSAKAIISGVQAYDVVDGYDDVIDKANALIDKYNEIGNTASITTSEIAKGVQTVGSVFADANTSVDEFIALLAAGNRQYQDADALALGLRTATLRIRGCTAELEMMNEETEGVYTSASKLAEKIEGLTNVNGTGGVKILEDDEETFRSIYEIFLDISKVYQQMSDTDQSALLELIAGKHRASAISATLNNMSEAQEIYQRSLESAGSAQREYDKYLSSSEAALNRFKASMTETYQSVIDGKTVTGLLNCGNATLQFVNSLGLVESTLKGLIAIGVVKVITTLSAAFKASAIQASNFGTALNTVKSMSTMAKGTTDYTNALKTLKAVSIGLSETQLKQVLASKALSESDRIAILRTTGLTKAQAQAKLAQMGLTQSTNAQTAANGAATASTFSLTAAVKGFGASLKAAFMSNPVGIAIMALSTVIGMVTSAIDSANQKAEEARQKAKDAADTASTLSNEISELTGKYLTLSNAVQTDKSSKEDLMTVQEELIKKLGIEGETIDSLIAKYGSLDEAIKQVTLDELGNMENDLVAGVKAAEDELKEIGKDYEHFYSLTNRNLLSSSGEDAVRAYSVLNEAGIIDKSSYGTGGGSIVLTGDDSTVEGILENYQKLQDAMKALRESDEFTEEELKDNPVFLQIYNRVQEMREFVDGYNDAITDLNQNVAQQQMLSSLKGMELPDTEEEFNAFRDNLVKTAQSSNEFIGSQKDIEEAINGYLATVPQFAGYYGELSNAVENATETINQSTEDISTNKESLEDIIKQYPELIKKATVGKLDEDVLTSTDQYAELLSKVGLSADSSSSDVKKLVEQIQAVADNNLIDNLKAVSDDFESLGDAYNTLMNKGESLSIDNLDSVQNVFGDLDMFDEWVRKVTDAETSTEDLQQAFDDLATEYLNTSEIFQSFLAQLTEQNKEYYATQLQAMGVENYEEVISYAQALNEAKEVLSQSSLGFGDATQDEIESLIAEGAYLGLTADLILALYDAKVAEQAATLDTSADCENLIALAGDTDKTSRSIQLLTHLMDIYNGLESGAYDGNRLLREEALAEVDRIKKELEGLANGEAKGSPIEPTVKLGAKGRSSAKSTGKEAADAYLESFEKELKDLDDLKDRGKITEKQYLDALRRLYLKYFNQKKKYLKEFEKYEHQYLDGMKSLYESAFSYITKQIDKRIDALNDERDAAVSALEAERDARLEAIEAQKEQLENEIEGIEKKIDAKEKEIKAMQDANAERKRAIDLQGKEYNLQRMQNQKTANVYKGGQMGYEADTSGVRDAKQEVEDAKLEIDVSKIEKEIDLLEDEKGILQERIELLEKEAEQVNKYYDNLIKQTELHYDSMIKGLEDYKAQFEGLTDLLENAQLESALAELGINMDALLNGSQEEFEKLKTAYIGILADMSRGNDGVLDQLSRLSGISTQSISYLDATKGAFEGLGDVALEGLESSVDGIGESVNALSTSAGEASTAVGKIQESVSSTSQSITPLNEELGNLKTLISGLTELLNNIKFPEIGDEGYAQKLRDIAQAFGEIASKCNEFKTIDFSSIIGSASVPSTDGAAMPGVDGMEGSAGTGFMGLASAISEAVASIDEQMGKLETALGKGNSHFKNQMSVINDEYLPAWESLQARLAEIIGVGGGNGDNKEGKGNQGEGGKEGGSGTGVDSGSIIGIMQTGGEEVAARLEDPWLKAFNDFATDGDNSIQTVCDKIIELVSEMARVIQEKCDAAASALNALAETASSSLSSVGGSVSWNTVAHAEGTVGDAFANGTGYNGLPHDEKDALRSEYGQQELAVYPNGKTELTTEPTMSDLPKGTVIFNEEQTRRIMDNEGKELGNAYDDGTITLADGTEIRPLNPSDREYWLHKKFDEFFKKNKDAFLMPTNAMFKTAESVDKMVEVINNNHTMRQNVVNIGDIHLHEVQDVDRFSDELILRFPNKVLQKMHRV